MEATNYLSDYLTSLLKSEFVRIPDTTGTRIDQISGIRQNQYLRCFSYNFISLQEISLKTNKCYRNTYKKDKFTSCAVYHRLNF
jgi:hypothetical protein